MQNSTSRTGSRTGSSTGTNKTHLHALDLSPAAAAREEPFGPRGVLLVGLDAEDAAAAESWFREMEGQGLPIAHCSGPMLEQTAGEALLVRRGGGGATEGESSSSSSENSGGGGQAPEGSKLSFASFASVPFVSKPDEKLPRLALLSGMTSAEAVAIASYWEQFARSKAPVVAALRPAMVPRKVGDLVLEATLASASASATAEESAGDSKRTIVDAESIREKVRASVEARRATRASGPVQIVIPPRNESASADSASGASSSSSSSSSSSPSASASSASSSASPTAAAVAAGAGTGKEAAAAGAGAFAAAERKRVVPPAPEKVRARGFGSNTPSNGSNSSGRGSKS
jgi:hypothetical protein